MRSLGKPLVVIPITIGLLFVVPAYLNRIEILSTDELVRAAELSIALLGTFLVARYELNRLERTLHEGRQQEIRKQMLNVLDYAESWLESANSVNKGIAVLRELSKRDMADGKLIISDNKTKPIIEQLVGLDIGGYTELAKLVDIDKDLAARVAVIWGLLEKIKEILMDHKLPNPHVLATKIAEACQAFERIRIEVQQYDAGTRH